MKAVYLEGEGVPGHDMQQVCPSHTKTYTLRVVKMDDTVEVRHITITITETESESQTTFYASPLMSVEPSKGRRVAGLAGPVPAGDDLRVSIAPAVVHLWERLPVLSSSFPWRNVKVSSGSTGQGGKEALSGAGVEFEIVMELREEVVSK